MLKVFHEIKPKEIAHSLGLSPETILDVIDYKKWPNLKYELIQREEREELILFILKSLNETNLRIVGENDNSIWEKGWEEITSLVERIPNFNVELLTPQYFEKHNILRFSGEYIRPGNPDFIYQYDQILRKAIFSHYLSHYKRIIEIGCGTGTSQILLTEIFKNKEKELVGADWAVASQRLLMTLNQKLNLNLIPVNFNMFTMQGHKHLNFDKETAVLTVHALEQLGGTFKPFLHFLLESGPALCVHIEPIKEFYEVDKLFDYLALKYHEKRNYLGNWLTELRKLESLGRLKILHQKRLGFGDRFHEAYSLIVWEPCDKPLGKSL